MDTNSPAACTNCRKIVTDKIDATGKPMTVWVCEHCGTENETPTPDAQAVQAELNAAVSQVAPPPPVASAPVASVEPAPGFPATKIPSV